MFQHKMKASRIVDCAVKCLWNERKKNTCNAYQFDESTQSCNLAKLDFLEDPEPGEEGLKIFVEYQDSENLVMKCRGGKELLSNSFIVPFEKRRSNLQSVKWDTCYH